MREAILSSAYELKRCSTKENSNNKTIWTSWGPSVLANLILEWRKRLDTAVMYLCYILLKMIRSTVLEESSHNFEEQQNKVKEENIVTYSRYV